jgi:hypothetical protein
VATLDDLRGVADGLPGSEERESTGGVAWFVRRKPYAWECRPWPSIPDDIREILAAELVVAVKVADRMDGSALVQMEPDVFLRTTTPWSEPKVAFRLGPSKVDLTSLSTWENIQNAIPLVEDVDAIKIVSNSLHAEKGRAVLWKLRPDLAARLVKGSDYRLGEITWVKPLAALVGLKKLRALRTARS